MGSFEGKLDALDLGLLGAIESQTTAEDRRSLLAVHSAVRKHFGRFNYLEIGSYLGGSLQSFVADPACSRILSLDPRPQRFPDERGIDCVYVDNSARRMLELLRGVPGADVSKIHTVDQGTESMDPKDVGPRPDLCFVDGEHTDAAVLRDAEFCLRVMNPNGVLMFHDANIVYNGLASFIRSLTERAIAFRGYNLAHCVFIVELGDCRLGDLEPVKTRLLDSQAGYLWSLQTMDLYRTYYRRRPVQWLRCFDDKLFGLKKRWARLLGRGSPS